MKLTPATTTCLAVRFALLAVVATTSAQDSIYDETFHFGMSADKIEDLGYYGRRMLDTPQRGMFNVPDQFHYSEQFLNDNPYVTEVGFINGGAAYFHIRKAALEPSRTLTRAEVFSLLDRCAGKVDWIEKDIQAGKGSLFKYDSDAANIYAYLNSSETSLFVWTTVVSPSLAKLDRNRGLYMAFADGQEIPLLKADEEQEYSVIFIDAALPDDIDAVDAISQQQAAAATAIDDVIGKLNPEKVRYFFSEDEFHEYREKLQTDKEQQE